jgi:hypothetical protein
MLSLGGLEAKDLPVIAAKQPGNTLLTDFRYRVYAPLKQHETGRSLSK